MGLGSRIAVLLLWLSSSLGGPSPVHAQDRVYKYTDREGRVVFTNAGNLAVEGKTLQPLALPPLTSIDFAKAEPGELKALDAHLVNVHRALQAGPECQELRLAGQQPFGALMWAEHPTELAYAAGFFVLALAVARLLRKRRLLRMLFAALPLTIAGYLAYDAWHETQASAQALRLGVEACGTTLPVGSAEKGDDVRRRLESVLDVKASIDQAQQQNELRLEKMLSEARH